MSRRSGPSGPSFPRAHSRIAVALFSPGTCTSLSFRRAAAARVTSARENCTPSHCSPLVSSAGSEMASPTCRPSSSSNAVPASSRSAGAVVEITSASRPASSTLSGFSHRFTYVVCDSLVSPSARFVAISSASERSVLSEKFQRCGSCEAITISRRKSRSISARVCRHERPVHTVSGSTSAKRPSPALIFGVTAATNAAPTPATADALCDLRRSRISVWIFCRSLDDRLPKSKSERVNGGFMIARSSGGSTAVSDASASPPPPLVPCTLAGATISAASPAPSGYCTAASLWPRKSSEPNFTSPPDASSGITYKFIRSKWIAGFSIAKLVAAKCTAESCTSNPCSACSTIALCSRSASLPPAAMCRRSHSDATAISKVPVPQAISATFSEPGNS